MACIPRITKEPEVRRNELMDIAEQLFAEKGYDHTSPRDIIRKAGVAQGTFYHYFRSRDDLVQAIIIRHFERCIQYADCVVADEKLNAAEKTRRIFDAFSNLSVQKAQFGMHAYEESQISNHKDYHIYVREHFLPLMQQVIRQGIEEGTFKVMFPEETAGYLLAISGYLQDELKRAADAGERIHKINAARTAMESLLCAQPGTF